MKTYPLAPLVRIRKEREELAEKNLLLARIAVEKAAEELEARKQEHIRYLEWCEAEEERLMGRIINAVVPHSEVLTTKEEVAWNKAGESAYLDKIQKAAQVLDNAKKALEEALVARLKAARDSQRINNHYKSWVKLQALLAERAEEADMEEIAELLFLRKERAS